MKKIVFFVAFLASANLGFSQKENKADTVDLFSLSLEEVLNIPIEIASGKKQSQESSPSIVSVITSQDIVHYGYRDISDILRTVPGFEFGVDVLGLYGLGFRGIWAHEGKALIMVNGMAVNCFGFGNGNYFGTIPVSMVDRIEIIRGPGSALYGGFAEVAVVNIITKKGESINGAEISGNGGLINNTPTYQGSVSAGYSNKSDIDIFVNVNTNGTPVSTKNFNDFYGGSYKMGEESSWRKFNGVYIAANIKKAKLAYNRNYTEFIAQDGFGAVLPRSSSGINTNRLNNFSESFSAQYKIEKNSLVVTPHIQFDSGNPIASSLTPNFSTDGGTVQFFNVIDPWQNQSVLGKKIQADCSADWTVSGTSSLQFGAGSQYNMIRSVTANGNPGLQTSTNPADTTSEYGKPSEFFYAQYLQKIKSFEFTLGGRYEITPFGNAFAPRAGITFVKDKFNFKALYGRAFRVPLFWQAYSRLFFVSTLPLKPEFSNSFELEVGYRISSTVKISANSFFIDITSPIVYIGANNSYNNYGRIQSMGTEVELQVRKSNVGGFLNFSYVIPGSKTSINFLDGAQDKFLALPTMKANAGGYFKYKKLTISPSLTYLGARYGQSQNSAQNSTPSNTIFETVKYDPIALLNLNLDYRVSNNFAFYTTVFNIMNSDYVAIQPYYGGHAPQPACDRQINLGARININ